MKSFWRSSLTCIALLGSTAFAQSPPLPTVNGKPVYDINVTPIVESSLARMWDSADAVLDVQIERSAVKGIDRPAVYGRQQPPFVRTFHTSRVLRVLKGDVKKGSTVVFSQSAGQLELPDKIVRIAGAEPLAAGDRYVVFLRRHEVFGPWILAGERDGAFRLRGGRVESQGLSSVAREQNNLSERQFSDEMDRIARRSRPRA